MVRVTVQLSTYWKIRNYFENRKAFYTLAEVRNDLNVDYESLKHVTEMLIHDGIVEKQITNMGKRVVSLYSRKRKEGKKIV